MTDELRRTSGRRTWARERWLLVGLLCVGACSSSEPAPDLGQVDGSRSPLDAQVERAAQDLGSDLTPDSAPEFLPASGYCEAAAELFCPFYMRCGRMVAETLEECRGAIEEMCNELYEPGYVALQGAGLLKLSRDGLGSCAAFLEQVPCEHHLMDLTGPCGQVWIGTSPIGASCGLDIESFICGPDATCALDMSFCGECVAAADTGAPCGPEVLCRHPDKCVEGICVGPALPGEECSQTRGCITGASCREGGCVARTFVEVGEGCDTARRCPYRSHCLGGYCVKGALLGEICGGGVACASGICDDASKRCVQLLAPGQPCEDRALCLSRRCSGGKCDDLFSPCLE